MCLGSLLAIFICGSNMWRLLRPVFFGRLPFTGGFYWRLVPADLPRRYRRLLFEISIAIVVHSAHNLTNPIALNCFVKCRTPEQYMGLLSALWLSGRLRAPIPSAQLLRERLVLVVAWRTPPPDRTRRPNLLCQRRTRVWQLHDNGREPE